MSLHGFELLQLMILFEQTEEVSYCVCSYDNVVGAAGAGNYDGYGVDDAYDEVTWFVVFLIAHNHLVAHSSVDLTNPR